MITKGTVLRLIHAIIAGWKISGMYNRILMLFYTSNLLFAIVVSLPFYLVANKSLNFSLLGGSLEFAALGEIAVGNRDFLTGSIAVIAAVMMLYTLLHIFLSGGAIAVFVAERKKYDAALFWGNCGYYFSTFFRLTLLAIILFSIILFFVFPLIKQGSVSLLAKSGLSLSGYWSDLVAVIFGASAISLLMLIFDFSKVHLVVTGERHIFDAIRKSGKAIFKNFATSFGLFLTFSFMNFFVYLLYSFISDLLLAMTIITILILFFLQQLFVILRLKLRLAWFAAIVSFYPEMYLASPSHYDVSADEPTEKNTEARVE